MCLVMRRAGEAAGDKEQEGRRWAPGQHVPSQLGLAQQGPQHCLQPCWLGTSDSTAGHSSGLWECSVLKLSPHCPQGGRLGGCRSPHTCTSCAKALGRETPSRRQQQMSPSRAPSELGAGQEINSGVSSYPDWGEKGNPPASQELPWHRVVASSGCQGIIAFLRRVRSSFVMVKSASEALPGLGGLQGEEGEMPPTLESGICPLGQQPALGIVRALNSRRQV